VISARKAWGLSGLFLPVEEHLTPMLRFGNELLIFPSESWIDPLPSREADPKLKTIL
jgi:hypothetical protein